MDQLSNDLSPIFLNYQIKKRIQMDNNPYNYPSYNNNYNYTGKSTGYNDDEFDEQNYEIKKLIQKANNSLLYSSNGRYNNRKNNVNDIYSKENGGNYNNYRNEDTNMNFNNIEENYIRNIPLEKNINTNRIKIMDNIYETSDNYVNEPMVYSQKETFPIKNSNNDPFGFPQSSQKIEYLRSKNSLVFSSDKIPFKSIKYGNMNRSIDLLFSEQK